VHVVAIAAGPAHALYFSCYERMKILFSGAAQAGHSPIANGLAGCFATLFHDAIMVPADGKNKLILKKKYILNCSNQTTSSSLCLSLLRCD
jgi:hypothetical protein